MEDKTYINDLDVIKFFNKKEMHYPISDQYMRDNEIVSKKDNHKGLAETVFDYNNAILNGDGDAYNTLLQSKNYKNNEKYSEDNIAFADYLLHLSYKDILNSTVLKYIDLNRLPIVSGIEKECVEPNQKWHLLISWYLYKEFVEKHRILSNGKKTFCYKGKMISTSVTPNNNFNEIGKDGFNLKGRHPISCPELLIWMAEASGIELINKRERITNKEELKDEEKIKELIDEIIEKIREAKRNGEI